VLSVLKHLGIGRAPRRSLFLGGLPTLISHLAAVESSSPAELSQDRALTDQIPVMP
jgi:hypothetical protein